MTTGVVTDDRRGPALQLIDGNLFHILDPDPDLITPENVAHALARLCRFTGHCTPFYSVAQHSVMVSALVPKPLAMAGLMHDASEAFIGDLSRPLKDVFELLAPGLVQQIEGRLHAAIATKFGFQFPHDPAIKYADNVALATERRDVTHGDAPWPDMPAPYAERQTPLAPELAQSVFLRRYEELARSDERARPEAEHAENVGEVAVEKAAHVPPSSTPDEADIVDPDIEIEKQFEDWEAMD